MLSAPYERSATRRESVVSLQTHRKGAGSGDGSGSGRRKKRMRMIRRRLSLDALKEKGSKFWGRLRKS